MRGNNKDTVQYGTFNEKQEVFVGENDRSFQPIFMEDKTGPTYLPKSEFVLVIAYIHGESGVRATIH